MNHEAILERLGRNIRKERIIRKLSLEEVSLSCQIDRKYLSRIERGKVNPTVKIVNKIARYFRLRLDTLFR